VPFQDLDAVSFIRNVVATNPDQKFIVASDAADGTDSVGYLEAGATDYLSKPYSVDELLARVQARLRVPAVNSAEFERHLRRRGVALDLSRRKANAGRGDVTLTEREFVLLAHLMTHDGEVLTREQLLNDLWEVPPNSRSNLVECYVARLRSKLGEDLIETVWKRGYCFVGLYVDSNVQAVH
jgi:DNA-binding response OmpR family regulator